MFDDVFDLLEAWPGRIDRYVFAEAVLQQCFEAAGKGHGFPPRVGSLPSLSVGGPQS
jgi:hypothetical protein